MEEARKRFGPNCAAGKFGVVKKDGSAPRLVGDSSVSNVNGLCRTREKIELPGAFVSRHAHQEWIAFSLDFKKAHKRIKNHPS